MISVRLTSLVCALLALFVLQLQGRPPYPYNFEFDAGEAIAFVGDETTYDGRYCQYVENFFYTRYPDKKLIFYNAGCLNDTAEDVRARLKLDVIDRKVDYVILQVGTWDGEFREFSPVLFSKYQAAVSGVIDDLKRNRINTFLMSPPMFDRLTRDRRMEDETYRYRLTEMSPNYNGVMGYYTSWLREEAQTRGIRFFDAWGAINQHTMHERKTNPEFSLTPDSVQPDAGGHVIIAAEIIETLAPDRAQIGEISLTHNGDAASGWESKVDGGTLKELRGGIAGLSFIWEPKSLPWVFPGDAGFGVEIAKINERFNREILRVSGLLPGRYELLIAGEKMGDEAYEPEQLQAGIALHEILNRPQYARAQLVANRNEERYKSTFRPLRDHWQKVKRTRVNFPGDSDRLSKLMTELRPQMEACRIQAKEKAEAIYESAKPLARHFEIRPYLTPEERKKIEEARKKAEEEAAAKKAAEEAAKKAAEGENPE